MIDFGQKVCGDLSAATSREWLETNGLGGFASSTIAGMNTRRYHGLLVAATKPPVGRAVLLSKLEETLVVDDERFELSVNEYPGAIHPQGHQHLVQFRLDPWPVFTYEAGGVMLEKHVFMVHGENTTVVRYRVLDAPRGTRLSLEVRPLIAFRDYHATTHENGAINRELTIGKGIISTTPYAGLPTLHLANDAVAAESEGTWYRRFQYERERERGLDHEEDLFQPALLRFDLGKENATIIASTTPHRVLSAEDMARKEHTRRKRVASSSPIQSEFGRALALAADQFIVTRGDQKTIIAGYPWFADWGRDTMIALPGLALATGRSDVARSVLLEFSKHVDRGMLPNRFPDGDEPPEYNTVDATLWFFEAARAFLAYTGDWDFIREHLYDVLNDIIAWHVRGTRHGIHMAENGLLSAGEPGVQLTWMDAKIGDWVVTPRHGKPVEIQALWYNALCIMEDFARRAGDESSERRYGKMAAFAQSSFNRLFWNEKAGCLYDVTNGAPPDPSIRPNQILAVSLHYTMLAPDRARRVVEVVERDLLTPFGLRSLAPTDTRYAPRYRGDAYQRDSVYHQGTVWPWLIGPFITAYLRVHDGDMEARVRVAALLASFEEHLRDAGLGQISEIHDADAPHAPRGCFAQAWSVSEVLRALVEVAQLQKRESSVFAAAAHNQRVGGKAVEVSE